MSHNGTTVEVAPSVKGRATIHDKDILIYCVSQLMSGGERGAGDFAHVCT